MNENISYDYLWQAYQKEKQTNQLLLVPKTFYEDTLEFISKAQANKAQDPNIVENATKLLNDFFEKRKQKILIYVAYNKQLPQPISSNETEFYNRVLQTVRAERLGLAKQTKNNTTTLKSTKDIPEIILPSGNKAGPSEKGPDNRYGKRAGQDLSNRKYHMRTSLLGETHSKNTKANKCILPEMQQAYAAYCEDGLKGSAKGNEQGNKEAQPRNKGICW